MPIPAELRLNDPDFWAMYFFETDDEYLGDDGVTVEFPVAGLELLVSDSYFDLGLRPPGADKVITVGWDDQAHWHPSVFRWEELDLLCRAAALTDPDFRHPGPMIALLARFLIVSNYDDIDVIGAVLDAAFTSLRPQSASSWPSGRDLAERVDYRREAVVWHRDTEGSYSVHKDMDSHYGADLYSTRVRSDEDGESSFPWAHWRAMLATAEHTLATAVDPTWTADLATARLLDRAIADRDRTAAPPLAEALTAAGCAHPAILTALANPVHPVETAWVLELLSGAPRGALAAAFVRLAG